MILVIRIAGEVKIADDAKETLNRMRLRDKYVAILLEDTPENRKLLDSVRNYVAYGVISKDTFEKLIIARAKGIGNKKVDAKKVIDGIGKSSLTDLGVKPFFRLHPPRKGIDSKKHFGVGKGVLGDNKEHINKLVERMLWK